MRVVLGPLVEDARGRLGGVVFSKWREINTARRYVAIPAGRSADQISARHRFTMSQQLWRPVSALTEGGGSWGAAARSRGSDRRAQFVGSFMRLATGDLTLSDWRPVYRGTEVASLNGTVNVTDIAAGGVQISYSNLNETVDEGYVLVDELAYLLEKFIPGGTPFRPYFGLGLFEEGGRVQFNDAPSGVEFMAGVTRCCREDPDDAE